MSLADDARSVDRAVYAAVAATETPALDRAMSRLSDAANYSRLWVACAAALSVFGGTSGRRGAKLGLASIAVAATVANAIAKPLSGRGRPARGEPASAQRHVRMPGSSSFPSGHSASALAFATGVARAQPFAGAGIRALAVLVAYSRVHTGVHYPSDVLAGAILGLTLAELTVRALEARGV